MPVPNKSFDCRVEEIDYLIRYTSRIVRRRGRDILAEFDITPPQFSALVTIIHHENLTMGCLCDHLYLASSTVTDLINRMEQGDLVERIRDERDRRVMRLRAKPRGHALLEQVMEARLRYLSEILSSLCEDKQEEIRRSLKCLYERMHDRQTQRGECVTDTPPPPSCEEEKGEDSAE